MMRKKFKKMRKNIIISSFLLFSTFAFSQVAIGKSAVTNNSVSLEFGTGQRGLVLPWVDADTSVTGAVAGTIIYDTTDKKVKVKKVASGWKDLSVDATGVVDKTLQAQLTELSTAKVAIGVDGATDNTPGILVLTDTNKAMILPKTTYSAVVNPAAGMMIYDTTAKQLAVFNGTVWSFWKP